MPRALIAGCGYVGRATAKIFQANGWDVFGWTRTAPPGKPALPLRAVNLADRAEVVRESFAADVVVHCASSGGGDPQNYCAVYRDGVANLVAAFPEARLFFTSSTSVYAQRTGEWVDEASAAEPVTETGKILREAEENLLQHPRGTVLRLAGIYGPGRSQLLRLVRERKPVDLTKDRWVNQAHRDDIAAAIFSLAQAEDRALPRIVNVADDAPALRLEILQWLSQRLEIPLQAAGAEDDPPRRRGESNKRVRNAGLRSLGWEPQFPDYQTAFERSILLPEK